MRAANGVDRSGPFVQAPQFEFIRNFLQQQSGLVLEKHKMYLLRSRLLPLLKEYDLSDLDALADAVRMHQNSHLARNVVDSMTTNETLFFRDQYPFDTLRDIMLPECISNNRSPIRIWSAAAATGQEAYSLAMTASEALPMAGTRVRITATDISDTALRKAASGIYTRMEVQRGMPTKLIIRYFEQIGNNWALKPSIRGMVQFRKANLVTPLLSSEMRDAGPFDIVFCRNVLIYFSVDTRYKVIDNLARCMRKHAYLVTGATEIPQGRCSQWDAVHIGNRNLWRLTQKP